MWIEVSNPTPRRLSLIYPVSTGYYEASLHKDCETAETASEQSCEWYEC